MSAPVDPKGLDPKAIEKACRAHAPQWSGMDPFIKSYAREQMEAAISAYLTATQPGPVRNEAAGLVEIVARDVPSVTGPMEARNVEPIYALEGDRPLIGFRVWDAATQPAGEAEAGIVGRLHKRADQLGMLLSDPPKPHPDAALMREAAAALTAALRERDEARKRNEELDFECQASMATIAEGRARAEAAEAKLAALQR